MSDDAERVRHYNETCRCQEHNTVRPMSSAPSSVPNRGLQQPYSVSDPSEWTVLEPNRLWMWKSLWFILVAPPIIILFSRFQRRIRNHMSLPQALTFDGVVRYSIEVPGDYGTTVRCKGNKAPRLQVASMYSRRRNQELWSMLLISLADGHS